MLTIRNENGTMIGRISGKTEQNFLMSDCYEIRGSKFVLIDNVVLTLENNHTSFKMYLWEDYTLTKE